MQQRMDFTLDMPAFAAENSCCALQLCTVDNYAATRLTGEQSSSVKGCVANSLKGWENARYQAGQCV
jgi:hypothetical protein